MVSSRNLQLFWLSANVFLLELKVRDFGRLQANFSCEPMTYEVERQSE